MALIAIFAGIHVMGEVLYKIGGEKVFSSRFKTDLGWPKFIFPVTIIVFSIGISLGIKVLYGILLGSNPLSTTASLFLGTIALFSVLFGAVFFQEKLSPVQFIGIILVVAGIILLV